MATVSCANPDEMQQPALPCYHRYEDYPRHVSQSFQKEAGDSIQLRWKKNFAVFVEVGRDLPIVTNPAYWMQ
jgi:hypothetical protein